MIAPDSSGRSIASWIIPSRRNENFNNRHLTVARLKHPVPLTHPYLANCPLVSVFHFELVPALSCEARPGCMTPNQKS